MVGGFLLNKKGISSKNDALKKVIQNIIVEIAFFKSKESNYFFKYWGIFGFGGTK